MLALYLGRDCSIARSRCLNAIGAAALALLVVNPRVLFGASFQLTFLCVWLVAAVGIPVLERTTQPFIRGSRHIDSQSYDFVLPAKSRAVPPGPAHDRRPAGKAFAGRRLPLPALATASRLLMGAGELLLISVVMQIGLALPMAYYFHRATVVGLPANMLVVPLMELLMPAAVAAMALGYVSQALARIPSLIAGIALEGIAGTVRWLGGLRVADLRVPTPGDHFDFDDRPGDRAGHGAGPTPSRAGGRRRGGIGRQRTLDFSRPAASADSVRGARDDNH